MWWKAQCVCLCHHQKHQQPYENSTDKHDVCMHEKEDETSVEHSLWEREDAREKRRKRRERAREKVIKEKEKWVSSSGRDQSKWLDAALSFVALIEKHWRRRRKERQREREKERAKRREEKCRAPRSYVCDCHIGGSSHADSERMKVVIDEEGITSPRIERFLCQLVRCLHINHFSSLL